MIWQISKFNEVYTKSENRKHRELKWVSLPVNQSSHGYQCMLDDHGDDAPAIYGAWCALLTVAALANTPGVLMTSRQEPMKLTHISRQTGFPVSIFKRLFDWAKDPKIGWLIEFNPGNTDFPASPMGNPQAPRALPGTTEQDRTRQDTTSHNKTSGSSEELRRKFFDLDWTLEELHDRTAKFRQLASVSKGRIKPELIVCILLVSATIAPELRVDLADSFRNGDIRKPDKYIRAALSGTLDPHGIGTDEAIGLATQLVYQLRESDEDTKTKMVTS